jgi:hypothetical protein
MILNKDTRGFLTHPSEKKSKHIVSSNELENLIRKLKIIQEICLLISCPLDNPDSCRGGFTNNICQKRTISQTRPGNCIMGDRSDMI